ncbi:metallophosphoesterase [Winogradskyella sp. 3972H.M.0a.05]|uniref:metallophosphoesterase family protein n=1 Tax=Winogradskyella sp. 3972H.M.0a.05 TaxID=2950277 RepID=UPI003393EC52
MRTIAIGDIHGGLKALKQLLDKIGLTSKDRLIFLGDYVDGWSESAQVIEFLIELSEKNYCVFIKGNHDAWCEDWLRAGLSPGVWLAHGGQETIESYQGFTNEEKKVHLKFFESMPMCHVDDENKLFIHAGFTSEDGVFNEFPRENLFRDRTLWDMAFTMDKRVEEHAHLYPNRLKLYKEIYIGHTPTVRYDSDLPIKAINVWNVDTGAAFSGKLSAIDIDTKEIFQSDEVMTLYPDEIGRNQVSYKNRIINFKRRL